MTGLVQFLLRFCKVAGNAVLPRATCSSSCSLVCLLCVCVFVYCVFCDCTIVHKQFEQHCRFGVLV